MTETISVKEKGLRLSVYIWRNPGLERNASAGGAKRKINATETVSSAKRRKYGAG